MFQVLTAPPPGSRWTSQEYIKPWRAFFFLADTLLLGPCLTGPPKPKWCLAHYHLIYTSSSSFSSYHCQATSDAIQCHTVLSYLSVQHGQEDSLTHPLIDQITHNSFIQSVSQQTSFIPYPSSRLPTSFTPHAPITSCIKQTISPSSLLPSPALLHPFILWHTARPQPDLF